MSTTSETVTTDVTILRCANVRTLKIAKTMSGSTICSLSANDKPSIPIFGIGRWKDTSNNYFPCLVTVSNDGGVTASYFKNNTDVSSITNGTILSCITYIV